ncbi:MAG: 16S rRNA (cytosine(1402)-N(4))-methyltransferase RsmH [Flavobacteriaceae bacterium]
MMAGGGNNDAAGGPARHIPVLLGPVVEAISPRDGGLYIDGTFGAGGYSRALLDAADCRVLAIDRDPRAVREGRAMEARYAGRLTLVEGAFADLETIAGENGFAGADGVMLDIGVSSMQLDEAERGFSFMQDGPLDMRMSGAGESAADIVNDTEQGRLADILFQLGEERQSRRIARAIAARRAEQPFTRTGELAALIEKLLGRGRDQKHPATRTFQALRIYVNAELQQLARGLGAAERILRAGGRLAVVTFHSLEDRIVKAFLALRSGARAAVSRHEPAPEAGPEATFVLTPRKAISPDAAEIAANPRARSAHLRVGERTGAPALPFDWKAFGLPPVLEAGGAA